MNSSIEDVFDNTQGRALLPPWTSFEGLRTSDPSVGGCWHLQSPLDRLLDRHDHHRHETWLRKGDVCRRRLLNKESLLRKREQKRSVWIFELRPLLRPQHSFACPACPSSQTTTVKLPTALHDPFHTVTFPLKQLRHLPWTNPLTTSVCPCCCCATKSPLSHKFSTDHLLQA